VKLGLLASVKNVFNQTRETRKDWLNQKDLAARQLEQRRAQVRRL
jgi:hypothetical protein